MRRSLTLAVVLLQVPAVAAPVTAIKAGRLLDVAREKVLENVVGSPTALPWTTPP